MAPVNEIEALARASDELHDHDPWDALVTCLHRIAGYVTTKSHLRGIQR